MLIIEGPEDFSHVTRNDAVLDYLLAAEHAITIDRNHLPGIMGLLNDGYRDPCKPKRQPQPIWIPICCLGINVSEWGQKGVRRLV